MLDLNSACVGYKLQKVKKNSGEIISGVCFLLRRRIGSFIDSQKVWA